jgi:hypothetical protein
MPPKLPTPPSLPPVRAGRHIDIGRRHVTGMEDPDISGNRSRSAVFTVALASAKLNESCLWLKIPHGPPFVLKNLNTLLEEFVLGQKYLPLINPLIDIQRHHIPLWMVVASIQPYLSRKRSTTC